MRDSPLSTSPGWGHNSHFLSIVRMARDEGFDCALGRRRTAEDEGGVVPLGLFEAVSSCVKFGDKLIC